MATQMNPAPVRPWPYTQEPPAIAGVPLDDAYELIEAARLLLIAADKHLLADAASRLLDALVRTLPS